MSAVPLPAANQPVSTGRSLAYVYVGYGFRYLYLLVLIPFYGRILGTEAYGQLTAAMSLFLVVWLTVEWGFPLAGTRDIAQARTPQACAQVYGQQLSGRLCLCLPAIALGLCAAWFSPVLRAAPGMAALAIVNGLVAAFNMGWFFVGTLRFRSSVWLEVLGFALNLGLITTLVHGPADAPLVMAILAGSSVVCTVIAHTIASSMFRGAVVRLHGGLALLRACFSLFVHRGLSMAMLGSTALVMSLFSSPLQVGLYGAADRLAGAALSLLQPANQVLVGLVTHRLGEPAHTASGYRLIRLGLLLITGVGVLMMLGTLAIAPLLVPLVFGPGFDASISMLQALSILFPMAALVQVITGQVLIPHRLDLASSWVSLFGALATVALIFALGQAHGGTGVSWARVAGHGVMLLAALWALWHHGLLHTVFQRP